MNVKVFARQRRGAVLAVVLGVAGAVAGCGTGTVSPPPGSTSPAGPGVPASTSPPVTVSRVDKARQDALVAYRGMWQDFVSAGATSDWQSPKLGRYATGTALTNLSRGLYADHYNGLVTKGEPVLNPSVSSVAPPNDPKKIVVADCGDSTHWLKYRADNGQLADTKPGGRQLINAIIEKQADGSWKVSDFGVHDTGTC